VSHQILFLSLVSGWATILTFLINVEPSRGDLLSSFDHTAVCYPPSKCRHLYKFELHAFVWKEKFFEAGGYPYPPRGGKKIERKGGGEALFYFYCSSYIHILLHAYIICEY